MSRIAIIGAAFLIGLLIGVLAPAPENSLAIIGAGLIGLALMTRRRPENWYKR